MAPGYLQECITIMQNARENMRSNNKGTILKIPKSKGKHSLPGHSHIQHQHCGTDYQSTSETSHYWINSRAKLKLTYIPRHYLLTLGYQEAANLSSL